VPAPPSCPTWSAGSSSKPPAGAEDDERHNELQRDVAGAGKPDVLENGSPTTGSSRAPGACGSESKIVLAGAEPLAQVRNHVAALLTVNLPPRPDFRARALDVRAGRADDVPHVPNRRLHAPDPLQREGRPTPLQPVRRVASARLREWGTRDLAGQ